MMQDSDAKALAERHKRDISWVGSEEDSYESGYKAFLEGRSILTIPPGGGMGDLSIMLAGYLDAQADTVRDLATAVRQLAAEERYDTLEERAAIFERLAQIKPRTPDD